MPQVAIREAVEADLPAILHAYASSGIDGGVSFTVDEAATHMAAFARYPSYRFFVAELDGTVAGTYALVILDNLAKRGAKCGVVEDVAVMPGNQGQGVGRAMMEHA